MHAIFYLHQHNFNICNFFDCVDIIFRKCLDQF